MQQNHSAAQNITKETENYLQRNPRFVHILTAKTALLIKEIVLLSGTAFGYATGT